MNYGYIGSAPGTRTRSGSGWPWGSWRSRRTVPGGPPVRQDFDRRKLVRRLKRDDVLYIRALTGWAGTIGRSLEQWRVLPKKGVDIVVLDMPCWHEKGQDLMGDLSQRHCPQVLSFVAENERAAIHQRQAEASRRPRPGASRFAARPGPCRRIFPPCTGPGAAKN